MACVVDASVVLKWFLYEAERGQALALLGDEASLLAPDLLVAELAGVLQWRVRGSLMPLEQARAVLLSDLLSRVELRPSVPLAPRAFELSLTLAHPVPGCFYLACAEAADALLVTADRQFLAALEGSAWRARVFELGDALPMP